MINIAFYANNVKLLAGTERATFAVANELALLDNFRIFIFSTVGEREDILAPLNPNITVKCLGFTNIKTGYINNFFKLNSFLKQFDIDVLISVEMISVLFTLPSIIYNVFRKKKIKYVSWEHFNYTVDLGLPSRSFARKLSAKFADGIVVLTRRDVQQWERFLTIKGKIINIANPSPFNPTNEKYKSESNKIIAVGRLVYQKGFDLLLEIWAEFLKEYNIEKKWVLEIVGSGEDGPELHRFVEKVGIEDQVIFIPNSNNISELYSEASFLIMTSRFEGLPMTLIEAQAAGLPIIAFDCITGPSEVITPDSGYLVPAFDKRIFKEKLFEMIRNSETRERMSLEAKLLSQRFNPKIISEKWSNFLLNL